MLIIAKWAIVAKDVSHNKRLTADVGTDTHSYRGYFSRDTLRCCLKEELIVLWKANSACHPFCMCVCACLFIYLWILVLAVGFKVSNRCQSILKSRDLNTVSYTTYFNLIDCYTECYLLSVGLWKKNVNTATDSVSELPFKSLEFFFTADEGERTSITTTPYIISQSDTDWPILH